jgi:hypothetical protein
MFIEPGVDARIVYPDAIVEVKIQVGRCLFAANGDKSQLQQVVPKCVAHGEAHLLLHGLGEKDAFMFLVGHETQKLLDLMVERLRV